MKKSKQKERIAELEKQRSILIDQIRILVFEPNSIKALPIKIAVMVDKVKNKIGKDLGSESEEYMTLENKPKHEGETANNLIWIQNFCGEAYQLCYSKNTIFYFEINEIKEDLYELKAYGKTKLTEMLSTHNSEYDCKRHAEKLYSEYLRKIYKQL